MTGRAWLNGGTFAHGAAGPPMVYFFSQFGWLGASDRSWADYSAIYCTAGVDPVLPLVTGRFGAANCGAAFATQLFRQVHLVLERLAPKGRARTS
jgi:hypothetical protein